MGVDFMRVYRNQLIDQFIDDRSTDINYRWYFHPNCFDDDEIERITEFKKHNSFKKSVTGGKTAETNDDKVRKSQHFWIKRDEISEWIYARLYWHLVEANKKYKFDLITSESIQYTRYEAPNILSLRDKIRIRSHRDSKEDSGDHYNWHTDSGSVSSVRKLSMVVQLTDGDDYEGGRLHTWGEDGQISHSVSKGCCIIFPSFVLHKADPVISGVRESLVLWAHGPAFR